MAGVKRKQTSESAKSDSKKLKSSIVAPNSAPLPSRAGKKTAKRAPSVESDLSPQSDTTEDENGFYGFSANGASDDSENKSLSSVDVDDGQNEQMKGGGRVKIAKDDSIKANATKSSEKVLGSDGALSASTSREAHQKQKALAKERRAAKPNADIIAQSKKLWEKLRRKSHVPKEDRQKLVAELFDIITGRVKDFVFKHDSVRVVQCALKYANQEQRERIAAELKGEFKPLAESRYAKFLVAKLVVEGGSKTRDMIVPEFYGHVKRLINHPEASWILDDIYRGVANAQQKAILLREWYGPEFALFKTLEIEKTTADLASILDESPEKRKPIMNHLKNMINQLIQKKMTGFTMLHDAMLQYFINTTPGSEEASAFLEIITPTPAANKEQKEEADNEPEIDLLKNLAFTASGSRVVCLALAYSSAKERKQIIRAYKDTVQMLAFDPNGHRVLLTVYDVFDDTRQVSNSVFNELVGKDSSEAQQKKVLDLATHLTGRVSLLYPFAGTAKWLFSDTELTRIAEVQRIRESTSKKQPETRRAELVKSLSPACVDLIASQADELLRSSFGCQFINEIFFDAEGDKINALASVAKAASGDPSEDGHVAQTAFGGRMLKTLVLGGRFNPKTKEVTFIQPSLNFHNILYEQIKEHVLEWACTASSLVVVNMLEADGFSYKDELLAKLRREKKKLQKAAKEGFEKSSADTLQKSKKKIVGGNVGAKILLERL